MSERPADPTILDVVPWSYGFAHSWALAWLLENEGTRDAVLELILPDGQPPWKLNGAVDRESIVGPARADLAFNATDAAGQPNKVAVETKVNDLIKPAQFDAYRDHGYRGVLYVPGLTGMMMASNGPVAGELWITGAQVAEAVDGLVLPRLIGGYVDAIAAEAVQMRDALAAERDQRGQVLPKGQVPTKDLHDSAWVVEVAGALQALGEEGVYVRVVPNDRGVYWGGSWTPLSTNESSGLYIDIVADRRTDRRAVALKTSGSEEGRLTCFDAANQPPDEDGWRRGRRLRTASTMSVWRVDVSGEAPWVAARHALAARDLASRVVGGF